VAASLLYRHDESEYRLLHAASLAALLCVGLYAASFGPVLPFLADDMDVSLDTAGFILTALFAGSITASSLVALKLHERDSRLLAIWGLVFCASGLALLAFAPNWPLALAGGVLIGVGDGLVIATLHILVSATSRDVPGAINRLNLYFSIGAVAAPIWAGAILATTEERAYVYAGICAVVLVTLALMIAARGPAIERIARSAEPFRLPGNPTAWIMGAVLFMYVGAEFGLGSWVSTYADETADAGTFEGALLASGYWLALLCGRIFSGVYFAGRRDPGWLLAASVAGAGASSLLLALTSGNIAIAAVAAFGAGFCLGPVWPTTVAIAAQGSAASATAATVTMGNSGGLLLPWLQGRVLVDAGAGEGMLVTSALCAVMFVIALGFRLRRAT
jgi:fucose permease